MTKEHWDRIENEFDDKFPAMGFCGDPKDNCIYRFDQYINDKSELKSFLKQTLTQALEEQREELKENFSKLSFNLKGDSLIYSVAELGFLTAQAKILSLLSSME